MDLSLIVEIFQSFGDLVDDESHAGGVVEQLPGLHERLQVGEAQLLYDHHLA